MLGLHHNNVNLLRAAAVLAVFAHHFQHYAGVNVPYLGTYGGLLGVQLFFLVSGYLIVQSAAKQSWWAFLVNRMFRIFPCYWVALLGVSIFISHVVPLANSADWPYFLASLLTLGHVVPYAMARFDVLAVSWTLTIEWTWYLLVPLLLWGSHQMARHRVALLHYWAGVVMISLVVSTSWVLLAQSGALNAWYAPGIARLGVSPVSEGLRMAFIDVAAPAQWVFFLLGVLLWVAREPLQRVPSWLCASLAFILLAQPQWWPKLLGFAPNVVTGLGLAAFFLLICRCPVTWAGSRLGRLIHWLGDLSYPIYLIHVPAIVVATLHASFSGIAALLPSLLFTLGAATLLHHGVENPGRRLGARVLRPRKIASL